MRGIYKVEIRRAIINRSLLISIIIGTIITVSQVVMCVIPTYKMLDFYILDGKGEYPASVFNTWIGGEGYTFHPELYNILIPLLACLPYAGTLYSDKKSGYCKNIYVKTEKRKYYKAKFIAVFLSGGIAVTVPLIINLYLTALIMPSLIPDASSMTFPIFECSMWSEIFYQKPYIYIAGYILLIFFLAGLFAEISVIVSFIASNYFVVISVPFVFYVLEDYMLNLFGESKYAFRIFTRIDQPVMFISFKSIIIKSTALLLFLIILYKFGEKKDEVL